MPQFYSGQFISHSIVIYFIDIISLPAIKSGVPAVSFLCGTITTDQRKTLPTGVQIMATHLQEYVALRRPHAFQEVTDHYLKIKPLVDEQLVVA